MKSYYLIFGVLSVIIILSNINIVRIDLINLNYNIKK